MTLSKKRLSTRAIGTIISIIIIALLSLGYYNYTQNTGVALSPYTLSPPTPNVCTIAGIITCSLQQEQDLTHNSVDTTLTPAQRATALCSLRGCDTKVAQCNLAQEQSIQANSLMACPKITYGWMTYQDPACVKYVYDNTQASIASAKKNLDDAQKAQVSACTTATQT